MIKKNILNEVIVLLYNTSFDLIEYRSGFGQICSIPTHFVTTKLVESYLDMFTKYNLIIILDVNGLEGMSDYMVPFWQSRTTKKARG